MRKAEARCRLKWARHGTSPPFWTFGPVQTGPGMSMWSSGSHVTLSAGGRWIPASGSAPAATPLTDRGEAASHRSRLPLRRDPPSGRDLDDGAVSQLLEVLAGEINRPSDRKRRISGYGDPTWRRN
jgi:hypothetical protein